MNPFTSHPASQTLADDLSEWIERFINAWENDPSPPEPKSFLPQEPAAFRHLVLVELIKVDLEYRWLHHNDRKPLESYLSQFPELGGENLPVDLVYEEFHIRKEAGDALTAQECQERFPTQAEKLQRLLQEPSGSRSLRLIPTAWANRPHDFKPGQQLDDFELLFHLGDGAFAIVFLARQLSLQRFVALKISANEGNEPQTLAQLEHPHIVRLFDQRLLPDEGLRLLYMQYVPGGTLQDVIARVRQTPDSSRTGNLLFEAIDQSLEKRGENPSAYSAIRMRLAGMNWPQVVCWLGACLAEALDYAHRQGVLHRDIKPANCLLTAEGAPKLTDFNISFGSKLDGANAAAYFGGTVTYMSPEQMEAFSPDHDRRPESLDGRNDIFSLGVVLWELLSGTRPFVDDKLDQNWNTTLAKMLLQRRSGVPHACYEQLPKDRPRGIDSILRNCLEPSVDARIETGEEFANQLKLCLQPRVQHLLYAPEYGWRAILGRLPVLVILVLALAPNLLSGWFNLVYNRQEIIGGRQHTEQIFWTVQTVVNLIAFPLGVIVCIWLVWPIRRSLRELRQRGKQKSDGLTKRRLRCLRLGRYGARVSLSMWLIAGIVYPVSLQSLAGNITLQQFFHFLISLALCGLIAVTFSFFGMTFVAVRVFYPLLLQSRGDNKDEESEELSRLSRSAWLYLLLAAAVPLSAMTSLVLIESQNRLALVVLSAGGLVGVAVAFWLCRMIQEDLAALRFVHRPASSPLFAEEASLH